jgi:hypothetical protein
VKQPSDIASWLGGQVTGMRAELAAVREGLALVLAKL